MRSRDIHLNPLSRLSRRGFMRTVSAGTAGLLLGRAGLLEAAVGPEATFEELCASILPGQWAKANVNTMKSVWPSGGYEPPAKGQGTPRGVLRAWSASAFDDVHGDWYFWGGGHANYNGNEMYRWRTANRLWERCSLPSHMTEVAPKTWEPTVGGVFSAPVSSHAYDMMTYLPQANRVFVGGGNMYGRAGIWRRPYPSADATGPYLWDVDKCDPYAAGGWDGSNWFNGQVGGNPGLYAWDNRDTFHSRAGVKLGGGNGVCDAAVENGRDVIYLAWSAGAAISGSLYRYELGETSAEDVITRVVKPGAVTTAGQGAGAWDPTRQRFVQIAGNNTGTVRNLVLYNAAAYVPGVPSKNVKCVVQDPDGFFTSRLWRRMGIQYDIGRDLYWIWEGEQEVYTLTPGTDDGLSGWVITRYLDLNSPVLPHAVAEIGSSWKGTLGKWVYDPNNDVFMGVYHYERGDIWVYKPPL
ncbi:MAG: hypothetical protein AB7Q97_23910 [Gammaproteobacteria bacterium]